MKKIYLLKGAFADDFKNAAKQGHTCKGMNGQIPTWTAFATESKEDVTALCRKINRADGRKITAYIEEIHLI